jgi:DNA polymerase I-like protein with 3'-5' exonuclease and polymerase domains
MSHSLISEETYLKPTEFLSRAMLANVMAVDTETNGLDIRDGTGFCVGISTAIAMSGVYYYSYFPVAHYMDNIDEQTRELLFNLISTRDKIVMHNAKFDLVSLSTAGFKGEFIRWYCTLMMAHFLNENVPKGLDWLSRNELKNPGKVKKDFTGIWRMGLGHMIPVAEMELYAGIDSVRTLQLFERLYPRFVKSGFDGARTTPV